MSTGSGPAFAVLTQRCSRDATDMRLLQSIRTVLPSGKTCSFDQNLKLKNKFVILILTRIILNF